MIYFIQDTGSTLIKIGYTGDDASKRLRALQTGCPSGLQLLHIEDGEAADESRLHQTFAAFRERGEWFRPAPLILAYIIESAKRHPISPIKEDPWPLKIYAAGKISGSSRWRCHLFKPPGLGYAYELPEDTMRGEWPITKSALLELHHYTGPYYVDGTHDDGREYEDDSHGAPFDDHRCRLTGDIPERCKKAIAASDVLFAWIDSIDCYGTIAEIGYAAGLGKHVWIAGRYRFRDLWFVYSLASLLNLEYCGAPEDYLEIFINRYCGLNDSGSAPLEEVRQ